MTTSSRTVHIAITEQVAEITLDRPEALNALRVADLQALESCLVEARDNPDVRVLLLTGSGTRAFCAGADLKATLPPATSFAEAFLRSTGPAVAQGLYTRLMDLSRLQIWKPVIAAVNGHCLGGGLEIALQCDLRVASSGASFGLPEVAVGSIPAVGGIQHLLRNLPGAVAMRMLLTGERIGAEEAQRIGLVSDLHAPDDLLPSARTLAQRIAANAPLAVQMVKRLAVDSANLPLREAVALSEIGWGVLRDTQDRIEGRRAFAEKRKPVYRGR